MTHSGFNSQKGGKPTSTQRTVSPIPQQVARVLVTDTHVNVTVMEDHHENSLELICTIYYKSRPLLKKTLDSMLDWSESMHVLIHSIIKGIKEPVRPVSSKSKVKNLIHGGVTQDERIFVFQNRCLRQYHRSQHIAPRTIVPTYKSSCMVLNRIVLYWRSSNY